MLSSADISDLAGPLGLVSEPIGAELVRRVLRTVIDPELGVNIVDLGLVYGIAVDRDAAVVIDMTLTTPGCPLGGFLDDEIRAALMALPQLRRVTVNVVWDPPWTPAVMSDAAKEQLGWR